MNTTIISNPAAPTDKQINRLVALGATNVPTTRSEASAMITKLIASRDMAAATQAQVGRAAYLGGRDLPGAGVREKSTQIYLLEALALWDNAADDDVKAVNDAVSLLVSRVRERFSKTVTVTVPVAPEALM